ncbi:MAG: hypothetical protein LBD78_00765 [Spirochaetaceae bacterium]|jgi:hypothetical protein|nr:hypothetical protein [Spirochaetaceae bacterium]
MNHRFLPPALLLFLLPLVSPGALDLPLRQIEDDSSFRISLVQDWFTGMPGRVINTPSFIHTLPGGGRVQVRAEAGRNEFVVILARERDRAFPYWTQGSWNLYRRRDDGSPVRLQIFLRSDPYVYVQFRPLDERKSRMDVVLYDAYVVRDLPIPIAFERLLVVPVEEILRAAGAAFPLRYFEPHPDDYQDVRNFIAQVRQRLPELRFRDDGAMDEEGRYVFIDTRKAQDGPGGLNCSGFVKWVVDGILRPLTGSRLPIEPLKAPFGSRGSSFTEPYEKVRDPFFGLDWTRNLASRANSILRASDFGALQEIEVQKAVFSSIRIRRDGTSSLRTYPGFLPNTGFEFEGLHPLLYTLAVDKPGWIYLASVSDEMGPAPRMRQHFHVAVLAPYFNERGGFQVAVFESAEETSFAGFKARYPGHFINLVRIPVEAAFAP